MAIGVPGGGLAVPKLNFEMLERGKQMEKPQSGESRKIIESPSFDAANPSSVSDILYLINSYHSTVLHPEILRTLDAARLSFVRGEIRAALSSVDAALDELDTSEPAYRDVIAFRLLVASMIGEGSERWVVESGEESDTPDSLKVVSLCVESDEHWHSGSLMRGLWLNRSAVDHSHDVPPIWRVYAGLLLAKKLSDIHISLQANRVIRELDGLIESSGLHVFGSLPEALRSVLHLQAGRFERATESAATAERISEETASAIGVKLALSVAATAQLARGEADRAAELLESFHAKTSRYALPDSIARAAFAEIALVAAREGPRAAADLIRAKWQLLSTDSACFIEDPSRPAWLVTVAQRAGDTALAERCFRAIERLANNNRGFTLLGIAADSARTALAGGTPELSSILDFGAYHQLGATSPNSPFKAQALAHLDSPSLPLPEPQPTDPGKPAQPPAARHDHADAPEGEAAAVAPQERSPISSLSLRETEIARFVGRGMTNQQVAKRLGLSPHTVNFHLRNIFRKLSISTRVKLGPLIAQADRRPDR
ncbi:LuxR C-terminal-related transcriptional regulator [Streptomyces sp. NBC_00879]|uniref:helix-turn-helix transcriptional regulator n=1 Tax=Streptomyces sp. NBC_00879 TaxID=2975855 RepID=UPI003868226A|nr:LuxR C-terminal-related transcriptional regulator [Streptomyces sp. NBC_00879]